MRKPAFLDKMSTALGNTLLLNPRDQDSELTPSSYRLPAPKPDETDDETVSLIRRRARESRESRTEVDEQTILSLAFDMGKQWFDYNRDQRRLQCLYDEDSDDKYWFITDNQIHPLVVTNTVRATQTRPDTYVAPLTDSKQDTLAAEEANAICAHLDRKLDMHRFVMEWANAAITTTTSFAYCPWNPDAYADIPTGLNPDGSITGVSREKAGEAEIKLVLGTDILVDPKATRFHDALWIIHEEVVSLTYIQERYPKLGKRVQATVNYEDYSSVESRIQAIANNQSNSIRSNEKNATVLYCMWEKHSPRFPRGRYIVMASGVVLYRGDWPYVDQNGNPDDDKYPYVPLGYQPVINSVWARNGVWELIPHQRSMNLLLSHAVGRAATDKLQVAVRRSSEAGEGTQLPVDAMTNRRNYQVFAYTGTMPEFFQPPGTPEWHFMLIDRLQAKMENIAGAHDVGNGNLPDNGGAGLSGVSINLLQQADQTKIAIFVGNIESALVEVKEQFLSRYRQYATGGNLMRLVGVDDESVPGKSVAKAMAFKHLKNGATRVEVTPGSGMPKTPEAQQQQVDKMFEMGALGDPKTPAAVENYLEVSNTIRLDTTKQRIIERVKQQQASQPTPEQVALQQQQMQQQAEQAKQQADQDHQSQVQAAQDDHDQKMAAINLQAKHQENQDKMLHDVALEHAKNDDAMKMEQFKAMLNVHTERLLRQLPPGIAPISVAADPTATVDIEKLQGIEGKVPPPPKPAAGKPSGANA